MWFNGAGPVWKMGGRILALGGLSDDGVPWLTFKVSDAAYEALHT